MSAAPKWTSIDALHRHWKKLSGPCAMNQPVQGVVDSGAKWRTEENKRGRAWKSVRGREQVTSHACVFRGARFSSRPTRKTSSPKSACVGGQRVGGGKEVLSPSLPNPAPSPFFMAHFSLRFPNYLKACYRLTTCIHHFQFLMVYIQLERRALSALWY